MLYLCLSVGNPHVPPSDKVHVTEADLKNHVNFCVHELCYHFLIFLYSKKHVVTLRKTQHRKFAELPWLH